MIFIIIKKNMKKILKGKIKEYQKFRNQKTLKITFTFRMYFNKNRKIF
jgi:hypothetical protein